MSTVYFGQSWDAPMFDDLPIEVDPPIGVPCAYCAEKVQLGDQGVMLTRLRVRPDGKPVGGEEPMHRECLILSTVGSVAHLEGRCGTCCGGDPGPDDPLSLREQGRAALAWLERYRT